MQLLESWDPLRLPHGSVRAILTLTLVGVLWALMLLGREVDSALVYVVLLVLGHYFGFRGAESARPKEQKPPLWLPAGSIRTLLVLGFAAVGYYLWHEGRLEFRSSDRNFVILAVAAALLAGFIIRKIEDALTRGGSPAPKRWFENLKAVVAVVAVGVFALSAIVGDEVAQRENVGLLAAPVIAFYFGSRK